MTNDTTTIEITTEQKAQLDDLKATGQAYKHLMTELIESYESDAIENHSGPQTTVTVKAEDMRSVIREELLDAMSEAEISVDVADSYDMTEADVRTMIQSEIDALKRELR